MEGQLKKLLTDDPSVVESSLEKCAEVSHPEKTGVIRRFVFLNPGDRNFCCLVFSYQFLSLLFPGFFLGSIYLISALAMTQWKKLLILW